MWLAAIIGPLVLDLDIWSYKDRDMQDSSSFTKKECFMKRASKERVKLLFLELVKSRAGCRSIVLPIVFLFGSVSWPTL